MWSSQRNKLLPGQTLLLSRQSINLCKKECPVVLKYMAVKFCSEWWLYDHGLKLSMLNPHGYKCCVWSQVDCLKEMLHILRLGEMWEHNPWLVQTFCMDVLLSPILYILFSEKIEVMDMVVLQYLWNLIKGCFCWSWPCILITGMHCSWSVV